MSAADGLEIPAVEIYMFLSWLQQQLEARAEQCFSPPMRPVSLYLLLDVTEFSVAHATATS